MKTPTEKNTQMITFHENGNPISATVSRAGEGFEFERVQRKINYKNFYFSRSRVKEFPPRWQWKGKRSFLEKNIMSKRKITISTYVNIF